MILIHHSFRRKAFQANTVMNVHHRVVAILHILTGALVLLVMLTFGWFFHSYLLWKVVFYDGGLGVNQALGLILAPFIALAVGEIVAAIYLLRGSSSARTFVIGFGVLHIVNFPLGTALGFYTLWALLNNKGGVVST
jgi:hypothetical protein